MRWSSKRTDFAAASKQSFLRTIWIRLDDVCRDLSHDSGRPYAGSGLAIFVRAKGQRERTVGIKVALVEPVLLLER